METNEKLQRELEDVQKKLRQKLYKLTRANKELHLAKNELRQAQRTLVITADKLKDEQEKVRMMKGATDQVVTILREFLFLWLSPMNQFRVKRMLRFYDKEQQAQMMSAILGYLVFGEKTVFKREVEYWHFKVICGQIDEDMITLPAHSLMVKLFKKYGLIESLNTYQQKPQQEESEPEDFRPIGEEW